MRQVQAGFRAYLNALADQGGGVISIADLPDEPATALLRDRRRDDHRPARAPVAARGARRDGRLRLERSLLVREIAILRATTSRPAPDYAHEQFSPN